MSEGVMIVVCAIAVIVLMQDQKNPKSEPEPIPDASVSEYNKELIIKIKENLMLLQNNFDDCQKTNQNNQLIIDQLRSELRKTTTATSCLGKLNDIHVLSFPNIDAFFVPCDSNLPAGHGWTVIQRRQDGSVNFSRNWQDYRKGFGELQGEFFIGLEKLHHMTKSQPHELYIHLEDFDNEQRFARYNEFSIADEDASYELQNLGQYSGNAGDSLAKHKNTKFSTTDGNNEKTSFGWWFDNDFQSNLNGLYGTIDNAIDDSGVMWSSWHSKPIKFVQMMIRPQLF